LEPPSSHERDSYERNLQFLAEESAKYAGLPPIPANGEPNCAGWRRGYKGLVQLGESIGDVALI